MECGRSYRVGSVGGRGALRLRGPPVLAVPAPPGRSLPDYAPRMTSRAAGRRIPRALLLAWLLSLALADTAAAHAELLRANPEDGETVTRPVTAVTGRYTEDLSDGSRLVIKDASGTTVGTGGIDPEDDRRLIALLAPALTEGSFTVESTARSADGHVERSTWRFTVSVAATPTATSSASAAASASPEPTPTAEPSTSPATSPSPSPSPATDPTSATGDVLLPIVAALAIVAVGAGFLLNRSRSPRR